MSELGLYLSKMLAVLQKEPWFGGVAVVLIAIGIYRHGIIKGLATVGVGALLLLNCYYYVMHEPAARMSGMLISLFLGAVGLMLFLYALVFAESGK